MVLDDGQGLLVSAVVPELDPCVVGRCREKTLQSEAGVLGPVVRDHQDIYAGSSHISLLAGLCIG